jgi:hypothetical protein
VHRAQNADAFLVRKQSTHRRDLPHLDAIAAQTSEDAMEAWQVPAFQ